MPVPVSPPRDTAATVDHAVATLQVEDVTVLRLGWWSKYGKAELESQLATYPGRSVWLPSSGEYAIAAPWRHRGEIAQLAELAAPRNPDLLVAGLLERSRELGATIVVAVELDETRNPAFYQRVGLQPIETVIVYEHPRPREIAARISTSPLTIRVADPRDPSVLATLLTLDELAFPWLWRNSGDEFLSYADVAGVDLLLLELDGAPIGYLGLTGYLGWGHIDRVAIHPCLQGRGHGREAVRLAAGRLVETGANRIGLSTQARNVRSQRLYERLGFRRMPDNDYRLYGRLFELPAGVGDIST